MERNLTIAFNCYRAGTDTPNIHLFFFLFVPNDSRPTIQRYMTKDIVYSGTCRFESRNDGADDGAARRPIARRYHSRAPRSALIKLRKSRECYRWAFSEPRIHSRPTPYKPVSGCANAEDITSLFSLAFPPVPARNHPPCLFSFDSYRSPSFSFLLPRSLPLARRDRENGHAICNSRV